MRKLIILFFMILVSMAAAIGQDDLVFGDTANTNTSPTNNRTDRNRKVKRTVLWIKSESKGLLIGNPCMEDVMREMGFAYLIEFHGQQDKKGPIEKYLHNVGVKTTLFFRNGPFWRIKLNNRRKECRTQTRDFVG